MNDIEVNKNVQSIAITGVNGFVGKHLAREIKANGFKVIGIGREPEIDEELIDVVSDYISVDLASSWPETGPVDAVIHLAGLAAVGPSFDHPQDYININSALITNMAEYFLGAGHKPRLLIVSSGAIYDPNQSLPLTEESRIGINSPYAVSKVLVENQCEYYRNRGLDCIVVRPFNHIGPGQMAGFLIPDVLEQLKSGETVTVGNISTKRDYTDVRDIARAYRLLATAPQLNHHLYNACSGTSTSGEEIVDQLKASLNKQSVEVIIDQSKVRPTDPANIYGDYSRLLADTGWRPEFTLEQTIADIIGD